MELANILWFMIISERGRSHCWGKF